MRTLFEYKTNHKVEFYHQSKKSYISINVLRRPGIEPRSTAWKAAMLTIVQPTLVVHRINYFEKNLFDIKKNYSQSDLSEVTFYKNPYFS